MAADGVLLCIDPFPVGRLGFSAQRIIARRELSRIRNGNLRWIRASGKEAALGYDIACDGTIEFLFIDGDHSYEGLRQDWEGWSSMIAGEGIVALHDSRSSATRRIDEAGSVVFTREVIHRDERFEVVDTVDTLTVLRRRRDDRVPRL
jgi:hypothetical protein